MELRAVFNILFKMLWIKAVIMRISKVFIYWNLWAVFAFIKYLSYLIMLVAYRGAFQEPSKYLRLCMLPSLDHQQDDHRYPDTRAVHRR